MTTTFSGSTMMTVCTKLTITLKSHLLARDLPNSKEYKIIKNPQITVRAKHRKYEMYFTQYGSVMFDNPSLRTWLTSCPTFKLFFENCPNLTISLSNEVSKWTKCHRVISVFIIYIVASVGVHNYRHHASFVGSERWLLDSPHIFQRSRLKWIDWGPLALVFENFHFFNNFFFGFYLLRNIDF